MGRTAPNYAKFRFRDAREWEGVRSQIINAMNVGKGTIEIDRRGDRVVYVYSPFLGELGRNRRPTKSNDEIGAPPPIDSIRRYISCFQRRRL
jgi:hypothetical protein